MQRRCLAFLLLSAACCLGLPGQEPWRIAPPSSVGCDAAGLDAAAATIRTAVAEQHALGAVILALRGRTMLLHEAFGSRDVQGKQPMQKDTLFRMASNTKAITAAAVLTLVDEGKLALDDPIAKWFPTWSEGLAGKVTVQQLLTHSSGLRIDSLFLMPLLAKSDQHPDAPNLILECARFAEVGPKEEPGKSYSYSNPGYNMLAGLVEVVTGKGFETYCQERFYAPLGMLETCNHESRADNDRMSVVVRDSNRGKARWDVIWSPGGRATLPFVRGSGGLIATASDYARFCRMVLDGGQHGDRRLLSQAVIEMATKNQIPHIEGGRYGFGWRIDPEGTFSHTGSDGTFVWCDPTRDLIGMVLSQTQDSGGLGRVRRQFRSLVSAACPKVAASTKSPK